MSPRTRRSEVIAKSTTPYYTRTSRQPSFGQHSSSPDQRPRSNGSSKPLKKGVVTRGKRRTRASAVQAKSSDSEGGEADGDDDTQNKNDEDDNSDDSEEPAAVAPSGPITRKRGHQTGLSLTLSNTKLGAMPTGTKRELSVSTVDSETRNRPRKMSKLGDRPKVQQFNQKEENNTPWDSDYDAVDEISESEHGLDDSEIERHEEQQIIESIEHETDGRSKRGRSVDSWADFKIDTPPVDDESQFFSEHFALTEPNSELDADTGMFSALRHGRTPTSDPAPVRRVRFADIEPSVSSSSSSRNSDGEEFAFPDLLFDQDTKMTRLIDPTEEEQDQYSDGSYWDFDTVATHGAERSKTPRPVTNRSRSCSGSSGYETDTSEGETTDEDPIPPQTVNRPQTTLRLSASTSAPKKIFRRTAIPRAQPHVRKGKGPCLGTWIADPDKPIGIVDHRTKKMFYVRPSGPSNSRPGTAMGLDGRITQDGHEFTSPIQTQPQSEEDISDAVGQNRDSSIFSPTSEVFFGTQSSTLIMHSENMMPYDIDPVEGDIMADVYDDDDPENQLNLNDFIDFGDSSSDSNGDGMNDPDSEELTSPVTPLSSQKLPTIQPKQSKNRTSSQSLLNHFDKGIVSAFRRNQHRHQSVLRRPVVGSKALAIKGGRHRAVSNPISPLRKRRADSGLDQSMAPFTGLNGTSMSTGAH